MRYRRPKPSIVLGTVAAVVVASPVAVLVQGSAPQPTAEQRAKANATTIDQVSLDQVPSTVLNLVKSGLADAGVTLPPIDVSNFPLPDLAGLVPPNLGRNDAAAGAPAPSAKKPPADTPAGAVVKEITRDTPFSMIGLTWQGDSPSTKAFIRAKKPDGSWGKWIDAETANEGAAGKKPSAQGTEPIWVGLTKAVQVAVTQNGLATAATNAKPSNKDGSTTVATPNKQSPNQSPKSSASKQSPQSTPQSSGTTPPIPTITEGVAPQANSSTLPGNKPGQGATGAPNGSGAVEKALSTLKAALINPGAPSTPTNPGTSPVAPGAMPQVITRGQWGADESMRCSQPSYDPAEKAAVVHHTAGNNDYTPEQSAEIVRGIYAYHAQTLGWCDVGYNALVDKYGQIFEGAFGGLDKNVQGTHVGGFNKETIGVALMGNLNDVAPTPAMINSLGQFLGWRLKLAGLNPTGNAQLVSQGFSSSRFPSGATVDTPVISGHRDFNDTECPGTLGYAALPQVRQIAATGQTIPDGGTAPPATPNPSPAPVGGTDVSGAAPAAPTTPATGAPSAQPGAANPAVLSADDPGAIAAKWRELGGAKGKLGNAQTVEKTTLNGKAKYVKFDKGMIYWSPNTGAQVLTGAIAQAWAAMGFENSSLGLPTSDPTKQGNKEVSNFQFGKLIYDTITGVINVIRKYGEQFDQSYDKQRKQAPAPAPVPTAPRVG